MDAEEISEINMELDLDRLSKGERLLFPEDTAEYLYKKMQDLEAKQESIKEALVLNTTGAIMAKLILNTTGAIDESELSQVEIRAILVSIAHLNLLAKYERVSESGESLKGELECHEELMVLKAKQEGMVLVPEYVAKIALNLLQQNPWPSSDTRWQTVEVALKDAMIAKAKEE